VRRAEGRHARIPPWLGLFMFSRISRTCGLLFAIVAQPTLAPLAAQDAAGSMPTLFGYVAVGLASVPRTAGSRAQQLIPYIGGRLQSGRRYVSVDGLDARVNLLRLSHVEFGPAIALTFGRDSGDIRTVRGTLPNIDTSVEAGAFLALTWDDVLRWGGNARVSLQSVRGVSGVHEGWVSTVKGGYSVPIGRKLYVQLDGSVRLVTERFAATFFDVTPAASAATGLGAFDARGGLQQTGASLLVRYGLSRTLSMAGFGTVQQIVGNGAESPIAAVAGRRMQPSAGLGLAVSF
jgi:MipA family protein